ncbi:MAG: radical SAM protein [Bacillota bacterium]|nr:radical SAM protein [Bacillota bacterium]
MKVLLVKCHKKTIFSMLEPIVTEPLELEYLSGSLTKMEIQHKIYDPLIEGGSFVKVFNAYSPDVLVLTGYITAVDTIISYSKYAKNRDANIKVVVGGVHAEVNFEDFFVDTVDFIVHSDGINTFEKILQSHFAIEKAAAINGIAFYNGDKWQVNSKSVTFLENMPMPNRNYFEQYKSRTKYMHYNPIAIVKTALSCPFQCNFCYCRLLNMGTYAARSIESVVEEIKGINAEYIWIVDDSFLIDRERVLHFIAEIKRERIEKKYIAYSRVDFIVNNEDIINRLAEVGFIELIIGMEAVEDQRLEKLNKHCSSDDNMKAAEILGKYDIGLTALFIVGIDFTLQDFKSLRNSIEKMRLTCFTVSIFTPLKGTEVYQIYENQIKTKDYSKYDFLHLTIKPSQMHTTFFYLQFYLLYVRQFFISSYVRSFVYKSLKSMFNIWRKQ